MQMFTLTCRGHHGLPFQESIFWSHVCASSLTAMRDGNHVSQDSWPAMAWKSAREKGRAGRTAGLRATNLPANEANSLLVVRVVQLLLSMLL
jgi:hypothetical protein